VLDTTSHQLVMHKDKHLIPVSLTVRKISGCARQLIADLSDLLMYSKGKGSERLLQLTSASAGLARTRFSWACSK
jgi:hypothetical protein